MAKCEWDEHVCEDSQVRMNLHNFYLLVSAARRTTPPVVSPHRSSLHYHVYSPLVLGKSAFVALLTLLH